MLLYFIRHGDPIYSPDSLTPLGHRQASAVAKRLCRYGIDQVFSSPMIRAQETAQPTCEMMHLKPQIEEWTSESLAWKDFSRTFPDGSHRWCCARQLSDFKTQEVASLGFDWFDSPLVEGTNAREGFKRIIDGSDDFFRRLGYERDGGIYKILKPSEERIALFAHGGFGIIWLSHMMQIPTPLAWGTLDITHSGVTVFEFRNYDNGITCPVCLSLSDLSHLYGEGLPMKYNNRIFI